MKTHCEGRTTDEAASRALHCYASYTLEEIGVVKNARKDLTTKNVPTSQQHEADTDQTAQSALVIEDSPRRRVLKHPL